MNKEDIIQYYIDFMGAKIYLEIGVRNGDSFLAVKCNKKIGVDIYFPHIPSSDMDTFYEMTSDTYFSNYATNFDVAFIDGDHTYEQSLRDAENCLRFMNPNGVILLHDCNPTRPEWATPEWTGADIHWCGEVWKTIVTLRTRPDLYVTVLNADFGLGVVKKAQPLDVLSYSKEEIRKMTYEDLEKNRFGLLDLQA